jgi:hypothetical protein
MAGITSAVIGAGTSLYGAHKQSKAAKAAAASTKPNPYTTNSQYGSVVNQNGQLNFNQAANPFSQMFNVGGLQQAANAFSAPGQAYYGAPQEVVQAAQGTMNTDQDAAGRLEMLRNMAAPESNRQALALRERLFGRGTLGSSGGAAEQRAFLDAENQADLGRQMTSVDWANQRAQSRFQNALSATGFGANLQQNAFNQATAAQSASQSPFSLLLQQGGLGVSAGGGVAPAAAMASAQAQGQAFDTTAGALQGLAGIGMEAWQNRPIKMTQNPQNTAAYGLPQGGPY